jgi:hypothetical protein
MVVNDESITEGYVESNRPGLWVGYTGDGKCGKFSVRVLPAVQLS